MQHPQDATPPTLPSTSPREYQHLLRGPRFALWRAALAPVLSVALLFALVALVALVAYMLGVYRQVDEVMSATDMSPSSFAFTNLLLAALIPCCMLATRWVHRVHGGAMSSVTGAFRWRWFGRCCAVLAPLYLIYIALDLFLDPPASPRPGEWLLLLVLVAVGTPWQAAGEEYLFRGLILQNVGACFANARFGLIVASLFSVLVFGAAHGSADVWIFIDLAVGAAACCYLAWRTGGLEAPIALHALNNVLGMGGSIIFGGWGEGFVDETSKGQPLDPLLTLVVCVIAVWLVQRLADRHGVARKGDLLPMAPHPGHTKFTLRRAAHEGVALAAVIAASIWVLTALLSAATPQ